MSELNDLATAPVEEIFTDQNGQQFDGKGNPIVVEAQSFNPKAVMYYMGSRRQPLLYADVYPGEVNVHQNVPLSDFAVKFELETKMFIAPTVAPVKTVTKRSDIFYKVGNQGADVVRTPSDSTDVRAVGAMANEVDQGFDTSTYSVVNHALRSFVPDELAENADEVLQFIQNRTRFLEQQLLFRWDARLINNVLTTGNFSSATFAAAGGGAISAATTTARYVNAAFNTVRLAVNNANLMGVPTHVIMTGDIAQKIAACPEIAGQVVYGLGTKYVTEGGWDAKSWGLPDLIYGVKPVVVPHVQNTAKKGQTASFSALMGAVMAFLYVEAPSVQTRNTITTFRKGGINVRTYRDEGRRGQFIEVEMAQDDNNVTNPYGGYLLTSVS